MARFRAEIKGSRGGSSRLGGKVSGIWSHTRGWDCGVEINGYVNDKGEDVFDVFETGGSTGATSKRLIAHVRKESFDK